MSFTRRVITKFLDAANLARHNDNYADIETELDGHDAKFHQTTGHKHTGVAGDGPKIDHVNLTNKGINTHTQIDSHIASESNPHNVTAEQAGAAPESHVGAGGDAHAEVVAGGDAGFMTGAQATKLAGIASGAEVNQNTFSKFIVTGQSDIEADEKSDTLTFVGGVGISVTTDPSTDKITFTATSEAIPGAHASSHITGGADVIPDAVSGGDSGLMSGADKAAHDQLVNDVTELGDDLTDLAGIGRTSETVKGNADAIATHLADTTPHATIQGVEKLGLLAPTNLTINSGAITVTQGYHIVDTEGSAAIDDLDTINGGSEGDLLILRQNGSNRDITIKSGTGNIYSFDGSDLVMISSVSAVFLVKINSGSWAIIGVQGVKRSGDTMTNNLIFDNGTITSPELRLNSTTKNFGMDNAGGVLRFIDRSTSTVRLSVNLTSGLVTASGNMILNGIGIIVGTGSPEGNITQPVGSFYFRTDVGEWYGKKTGTGNTGWGKVTVA